MPTVRDRTVPRRRRRWRGVAAVTAVLVGLTGVLLALARPSEPAAGDSAADEVAPLLAASFPTAHEARRDAAAAAALALQRLVVADVEVTADSAPDDAVRLEVGDDFAAVVAGTAPGTTFVIAAGVHRRQSVSPRDGDRFVGEPGAVMNGARAVDGWTRDGAVWVVGGQTDDPQPHGELEEEWINEGNPHDVFVDGRRLRHVATRARVGPGTFFYDYAADELVVGDDPTGAEVELSVTRAAFETDGSAGVQIADLTITRYASPAQIGAIEAYRSSEWTIARVVVADNHGTGIKIGSGTVLRDCEVTGNGQLGVGGGEQHLDDRRSVVTGCDIHRNGILGYQWIWEAGGTKFVGSDGLVFAGNEVHSNRGPGVWFDIDNFHARIIGNDVHDNSTAGIYYEISYGADIAHNVVTDNGVGAGDPAGIVVANSSNVVVRENFLSGNTREIAGWQADGPLSTIGLRQTVGLQVRSNDITVSDGEVGLRVDSQDRDRYLSPLNVFASNRYVLDDCEPCFRWGDRLSLGEWLAAGNDRDATITREAPARPGGGG